jgi:hypothetical protein
MWLPKTTKDLEEAIANGTLPREPTAFEVKAQLPATTAKNPDIAVDVAAMATDGGCIVYGVAEDKAAGTFTANPIPLQGVKEKIGQIVESHVQERIEFEVYELPLDNDPTRGYVVVEVPVSARAPHMVESKGRYQYYGRQPGGNTILGEAEVARLYERRQRVEENALKALDEAIAYAPIYPTVDRADLHLVVVPLVSNSDLREKAMAGQGQPALVMDVNAALAAIRFDDPWDPKFNDVVVYGRPTTTLDGVALVNDPIEREGQEPNTDYVVRLELTDNGTCRYFHANLGAPWGDEFVLRDNPVAHLTAHFCVMAGNILERAGYMGAVEVLIAVTGAAGAVSGQWLNGVYFPRPSGKPAVPTNDYRNFVRVPASKLRSDPIELARSLTVKLLRTIRPEGFPDPLAAS